MKKGIIYFCLVSLMVFVLGLATASAEEPMDVYIDIKPNSYPNPLNLKGQGILPVAILGMEDFDVTYYIDPASIKLNGGLGVSPLRWSFEDVARPFVHNCHQFCSDGYPDIVLMFDKQELIAELIAEYGVELEDGVVLTLSLTGKWYEELSGTPIRGQDVVQILIKGMDQPK